MKILSEISGKEIATAVAIAATACCIYKMWRGRKVNHIPSWDEEDNNPANWYLKDPKKLTRKDL